MSKQEFQDKLNGMDLPIHGPALDFFFGIYEKKGFTEAARQVGNELYEETRYHAILAKEERQRGDHDYSMNG